MDVEDFIRKEHPIWNIIGSYISRVCGITSFVRLIEYIEQCLNENKTVDERMNYRRGIIQRDFIANLTHQEKYGYYHYLIINNLSSTYESQIMAYFDELDMKYCYAYVFMGFMEEHGKRENSKYYQMRVLALTSNDILKDSYYDERRDKIQKYIGNDNESRHEFEKFYRMRYSTDASFKELLNDRYYVQTEYLVSLCIQNKAYARIEIIVELNIEPDSHFLSQLCLSGDKKIIERFEKNNYLLNWVNKINCIDIKTGRLIELSTKQTMINNLYAKARKLSH